MDQKFKISPKLTENSWLPEPDLPPEVPPEEVTEDFSRIDYHRHVSTGIEIKSVENVAFSSTVFFVLEFQDFNPLQKSVETRKFLAQLQEDFGCTWAKYLVLVLGIFDWEKDVAYIRSIDEDSISHYSSFIPALSFENALQVMVNFQIKIKQVGAESDHVMIRDLPSQERFLRKNLMLDLAILLQHEIQGFIEELPAAPANVVVAETPVVLIRNPCTYVWLSWKLRLTVRDMSFEDHHEHGVIRCSVLKLQTSHIWTKGYLLSRELGNQNIPLLWAKKTAGFLPSCSLFEANGKDKTDGLLLGLVRSSPFGRHTIYETFQTPDCNYLKEVGAVKQQSRLLPSVENTIDDGMTLLLPRDPQYMPSPSSWKRSKGAYKYKALAKKFESGDRSDLRAFRNDLPDWTEKVRSKMTKIQINDDAGNLILRVEKLKTGHYILEYTSPFDALTAFSVVLSTL